MSGALSHLRVLDLSRVLAGPWGTQILADLGADVIKVERPKVGDETRSWGPPFVKDREGNESSDSAYYLCANRNKRSITIDFTKPEGAQLVRALATKSDVVMENFRPSSLRKYGLDYDSLRERNPALVYCSITGFGQTGPYASRPGYDFLIQGMGGLMSITGRPDGEPGSGPMKVGVALTDILTGVNAATAILAAVIHRDKDGDGQHIDMALLDVQVGSLANQTMNFLHGGNVPVRLGNAHPNVVPYQDFRTSDGFMILAVGNDRQFAQLSTALERPGWIHDERFATGPARLRNREELVSLIDDRIATRTTNAWIEVLELAGVPCGPINDLEQVFNDPQVVARGMKMSMHRDDCGDVPLVASPLRLSGTPVEYRIPPPRLGEHTRDVLQSVLGLSSSDYDVLVANGVV